MTEIIIFLLCGVLFWLGGRDWAHKAFRRIGIPLVLAMYSVYTFKIWWLFFVAGISYALTISIGYGAPSPDDDKPSWLGKVLRIDWLIRGTYGLIVACFGALGLVWAGFMPLIGYSAYLVLNFVVGAVLCHFRMPDYIIEPAVGLGIGIIVFLI